MPFLLGLVAIYLLFHTGVSRLGISDFQGIIAGLTACFCFVTLKVCIGINIRRNREQDRRAALQALRNHFMSKYGDETIVAALMRRSVQQGMTFEMVVDALGLPVDRDRKITPSGEVVTLKYHQDGVNRFRTRVQIENDRVVGFEQRGIGG